MMEQTKTNILPFLFDNAAKFDDTGQIAGETMYTNNRYLHIYPSLLLKLWRDFFKFAMNPNATALDILLNKNGDFEKFFLTQSNEAGYPIKFVSIPKFSYPIKKLICSEDPVESGKQLENAFNKAQTFIQREYQSDLGNLRIYSEKASSWLSALATKIKSSTNLPQIEVICNEIAISVGQFFDLYCSGEICLFPIPPIIAFLFPYYKRTVGVDWSKLGQFFGHRPEQRNLTLIFRGQDYYLGFFQKKRPALSHISEMELPAEINEEENVTQRETLIASYVKKKYQISTFAIIDIERLIALLDHIFISPSPLAADRSVLLLEEILGQIKAYGEAWKTFPDPIVLNEELRYWRYRFNFHYNLRKIAYWALPHMLFDTFGSFLGVSPRIALVFRPHLGADSTEQCILVEFAGGKFEKAFSVDLRELKSHIFETDEQARGERFSSSSEDDESKWGLLEIRKVLAKEYGFIHLASQIDPKLIPKMGAFIRANFVAYGGFVYLKLRQLVRCLQNPKFITFDPEPPAYLYLKNQSPTKIIRQFLDMGTDLNEF